jgi:hypothetical protein
MTLDEGGCGNERFVRRIWTGSWPVDTVASQRCSSIIDQVIAHCPSTDGHSVDVVDIARMQIGSDRR